MFLYIPFSREQHNLCYHKYPIFKVAFDVQSTITQVVITLAYFLSNNKYKTYNHAKRKTYRTNLTWR